MLRNRIKKKLKSDQGTSIFFGLLLFMVASILSAVMISAAVTTVKRVESDRKAEQNYLTCSSAAKLLRDAIANTEIVKTTKVTKRTSGYYWDNPTSTETIEWKTNVKNSKDATKLIAEFLLDYIKNYNERNSASTTAASQTCKISVPKNATDTKGGLEDVTADCTISTGVDGKGYTITIKLKSGEKTDSCQIALKLEGSLNEKTNSTPQQWIPNGTGISGYYEQITTTTATYSWVARDTIFGDKVRTSEAG